MRFTQQEKYEIIQLIDGSDLSANRILKEAGLITAPVHIVMSAAYEFENKTVRTNQMWQTDFTYFKIVGWGWYFFSTVIDDFSRFIMAWDLRSNMTSKDVEPSVDEALRFAGLTKETAPVLLTDHGKCYISAELRSYLAEKGIKPINGKPYHPQTQVWYNDESYKIIKK